MLAALRFNRGIRPAALRSAGFAALHHGEESTGKCAIGGQIVEYAASFRKKGEAGYMDAMQILEHGLSLIGDAGSPDSLCKVRLAMATFHADKGKLTDAAEALTSIANNTSASLEVRACALEALAGIHLQLHQDDIAAQQSQLMCNMVVASKSGLVQRATALSSLVKLAEADYESASSCFHKLSTDTTEDLATKGACSLAHAELLHARGDNTEAKNKYEEAIGFLQTENIANFLAPTMSTEEVHTAALAGLGQLSTELGSFGDAEKALTEALHLAESISGDAHMRVGLVLSCMANLYSRRAKAENTGFMIAEGLYRRSLDLLKAPPLDKVTSECEVQFIDVIALTRERYGDILSMAKQREGEGAKLKSWAAQVWRSRRPFRDAVEHSVVDVRLGRVF